MYRRSATVTVSALAAAAEETYTITDSGTGVNAACTLNDVIVINPPPTAEVGWGIIKAWVDSRGVIKFTASNFGAGSLTGGSVTVRYAVIR